MAKPTVDEGVNDPRALGLRDLMLQSGPYTPAERGATQSVVEAADADPSIRRALIAALAQHDDKLKAAELELQHAQEKVERSTWANKFRPILSVLFPPLAGVRAKSENALESALLKYETASKDRASVLSSAPLLSAIDEGRAADRKFNIIEQGFAGDPRSQARLLAGAGLPKTREEVKQEGLGEVDAKEAEYRMIDRGIREGWINADQFRKSGQGESFDEWLAKRKIEAGIQRETHRENAAYDKANKPRPMTGSPTLDAALGESNWTGADYHREYAGARREAERRHLQRLITTVGANVPDAVAQQLQLEIDSETGLTPQGLQQMTTIAQDPDLARKIGRDAKEITLQRLGYFNIDDFVQKLAEGATTREGATPDQLVRDIEFLRGPFANTAERKRVQQLLGGILKGSPGIAEAALIRALKDELAK